MPVQMPKSLLGAISYSRPAVDHGVQLRELRRRKENGSRGKSKLEIGGGWLAEHVGGGDEVEQVVDELQAMLVRTTLCLRLSNLEGDAQVLPVQEGIVSLDGACLMLKVLD